MKTKKLLAVEYEKNLTDIYTKDFGAQEGLTVEVTPNSIGKPMDEVAAILKSKPDVLLLYIRPEGEGITVLEELHRKKKMPYTIVLSYDKREEIKDKCLKLGAKEFHIKSEITLSVLWRLIARHLGYPAVIPWRKDPSKFYNVIHGGTWNGCEIYIWKGDITTLTIDAIVNAANTALQGGAGVDGAIHNAGGPTILEECHRLMKGRTELDVGEAVPTGAGQLRAKHVIHVLGPRFYKEEEREPALLASAYHNALSAARKLGVTSIAFPCISTGFFAYPSKQACEIAVDAVRNDLMKNGGLKQLVFCTFNEEDHKNYLEKFNVPSSTDSSHTSEAPMAIHDDRSNKDVVMDIPIEMINVPDAVKNVSKEYIEAEKAYPPFSKSNTDYAAVIQTLDQALQLLPDDPVLLGKKGNCLESLQKYDEALAVYERALSKYPTFLPNMYNKVFCLERIQSNNEACIPYYDEILKYYPYEVKALANKAKMLKRLNRWSEALDYCSRALLLDSEDFTARYVLEQTENHLFGGSGRGRNSEAAGGSEIGNNLTRLMSVESALAKDPKDTKLLELKGNFLEALGKHKQALGAYEEAIKHDPKNLPNLYNKAFCLARMKRYKECINFCNAIAQISDHDSKTLALKGELLKKMNRLQEGLWCSYMALYNDPSEPTAQNNIEEISAIFDGKTSNKYAVFANLKLDNLWSKLKWRMRQLDHRLFPSSLRNKNPQGHLFFSAEPPPKEKTQ